jgi:hypothetical protein
MKRQLSALAVMALACVYPALAGAQAGCTIQAPDRVDTNQSFTLCGPSGSGYEYDWSGPGLEYETARCVTAQVQTAGTYEYLLVITRNGRELDRCKKTINVGASTGGARSCAITGPTSIRAGQSARLCGPGEALHTYSWTGPNGFRATGACATVTEAGTYYLTSQNVATGSRRQCTHRLTVVGGELDCISGPTTIAIGGTARLCAPSRGNITYRWTGPAGFSAFGRCATVDEPGTYTVSMRDEQSGRSEQCSQTLTRTGQDDGGTGEDPDEVVWDNCPRPLQFWSEMFDDASGGGDLSQADLRAIARHVDDHSANFNWRDDLDGMRQALRPSSPLTRRKQVARQFAALLANVAAGELNVTPAGRNQIRLDLDTQVDFPGATTLRDLISITDRTLRGGRGDYSRLNSTLTRINRGQGIGPVCD